MGIYEELEWRGLIKDVSDPSLKEKLNAGGMTFYIGTDPTGDSLHIGHFSSFLISKRLKDAGHNPILLVGGGTGLIGDLGQGRASPAINSLRLATIQEILLINSLGYTESVYLVCDLDTPYCIKYMW